MDLTSDLKPFQDRVTSSLLDVTRTAGQISAEDLSFHRSSNRSLSRSLDAQNIRLLQLTQRLLTAATTTGSSITPPKVQDIEGVEDSWRSLVDVVDDLLERADACLDEYTGVIKRLSPAAQDGAMIPTTLNDGRSKKKSSTFAARQLPKPQLLFENSHKNHEVAPFKPLLRTKPHSVVDLDKSIGEGGDDGYNHPYAVEIEQASYPEGVYQKAEPLPYKSPANYDATFVDTKEGIGEMLAELREASEIAVDLEHHDTHSYVGIVCLMQISTREKDWIIDTLVPWREELQILNEVFADPKILKVFQGSTMDMIWLQRDLGLYVVGLFDTFHASTALGFPQKSLKYLLERFCDYHANKKLQMADWRIRPIPDEMLEYARSDTHYLLFIYDNLRNLLLEASSPDNNLIDYVLQESKKEALQRYDRTAYDVEKGLGPVGWFAPLARRSIRFTPEQFAVYRAVHEWRDRTARALDESPMFIMSQGTLFAVAETMPTTVPALITATNPVSRATQTSSRELVEIIKRSKEVGRDGPTLADVMRENEAFLPRRRNPGKTAERASQDQGVAATLQMLNGNGSIDSSADRSFTSRFWGTVGKSFVTTASRCIAPLNDAWRMVLPLPALSDDSFTVPAQPISVDEAVGVSTSSSPHLDRSGEKARADDVFILKELDKGSKRKAAEADLDNDVVPSSKMTGELDANTDYSPIGNYQKGASEARAEAKVRPREEKRRKKALGKEEDAIGDVLTEPFDYANTGSILSAESDRQQRNGSAAIRGEFNPYAKALDGPQGLKRARKETAGRSFTFKK
ncbi:hypothetical protein GJ744_012338 [Endocarpon pusillum]|uniref:HRDC domain-containing protein n=1 Tax=Endocarpon pusillum TaxID=364733 RepID=A0A8H7E458_9EURO|nr:hypothetical protein GJ744_012338 [Endocarpon pusillum]